MGLPLEWPKCGQWWFPNDLGGPSSKGAVSFLGRTQAGEKLDITSKMRERGVGDGFKNKERVTEGRECPERER